MNSSLHAGPFKSLESFSQTSQANSLPFLSKSAQITVRNFSCSHCSHLRSSKNLYQNRNKFFSMILICHTTEIQEIHLNFCFPLKHSKFPDHFVTDCCFLFRNKICTNSRHTVFCNCTVDIKLISASEIIVLQRNRNPGSTY